MSSHPPIFPVVALGASAGGLDALSRFFAGLRGRNGIAFVVVQHLSPTQGSLLTDILARSTDLCVAEARHEVVLKPEHVYVIPPNRYLTLADGRLHLHRPGGSSHPHRTIDRLFLSLAEQLRQRAIAIVLSGTGTDGSEGIQAVKNRGGLTIAQDPASAAHRGMPESAIATGSVDLAMPPEAMGDELVRYRRQRKQIRYVEQRMAPAQRVQWLAPILELLREIKGHDFSHYKSKTVMRRIGRRMAVHNIDNVGDYTRFLADNPAEAAILAQDFLIRVTSFFRDRGSFGTLETEVIPGLISAPGTPHTVRVWVPGCSTGEEAYSIAMLLEERRIARASRARIQIFATDIDVSALDIARAGLYPTSIAADLTAERLARFFDRRDNGYQVKKTLRDMLVFAEQSLIKDPPFSRMDLVSCRNLLIYIQPAMQKRILALLRYALKPNGILFLGASETIGSGTDLFEPLHQEINLYRRLNTSPPHGRWMDPLFLPDPPTAGPGSTRPSIGNPTVDLAGAVEITMRRDHTPPCVVVNEADEVVYFHGHTGCFLEPPAGRPTHDIGKMARAGLGSVLRTVVHQARGHHQTVHIPAATPTGRVRLTAVALREPGIAPGMVLVLIQDIESEPSASATQPPGNSNTETQYATLRRELHQTREALQATIEKLETANQALQSGNEELQSSNEELQSSNEELETSREELQSVNEELQTVNAELEQKIEELSRVNDDMNNLLASTAIGMIFLDRHLNVQRFTPAVTRIVPLIHGDIGRPLAHLNHGLEYDQLVEDLQHVLANLVQCEREVRTHTDQWYRLRIRPYHTADHRVGGAVVAFLDITDTVRLRATHKLSSALECCPLMIVIVDSAGRLEYANAAFRARTGRSFAPGERPTLAEIGLETDDPNDSTDQWFTRLVGKTWVGTMKLRVNNEQVIKIATNLTTTGPDNDRNVQVAIYMDPAKMQA